MLLQIQDGTLSIGAQTVLAHFDFEIRGNEKIAIVERQHSFDFWRENFPLTVMIIPRHRESLLLDP